MGCSRLEKMPRVEEHDGFPQDRSRSSSPAAALAARITMLILMADCVVRRSEICVMLLAPALVALQLVAAHPAAHPAQHPSADQVPTLDVGPGCRAAVDVSGISTPEQSCLNDEQAARSELT